MNKQPVYYMQTDPRWKDTPYQVPGETTDIGESGCGPACAAMLIETITGKTCTPVDTCAWSVEHGYKALKHGTYYSYFPAQFAYFGIHCTQLNWENSYGKPNHSSHQKILKLLKEGYYIIAVMGKGNWTRSGHFVVVWWADDKIRINDPASKRSDRLNGDPETFFSQVKYYWVVDARDHNKKTEEQEEEEMRYNTIKECPEWAQKTVQKLLDKKLLNGGDAGLDLSRDMLRILVINDRAGMYGK